MKQNHKELNWRTEFRGCPPEIMLARFFSIGFSICATYTPQKKKIQKTVRNKIPRDRKNLMRKRQRRLKAVSRARSPNHKAKLLAVVRKIEKELKSSYENELAINEHKAVLAISKNSKNSY